MHKLAYGFVFGQLSLFCNVQDWPTVGSTCNVVIQRCKYLRSCKYLQRCKYLRHYKYLRRCRYLRHYKYLRRCRYLRRCKYLWCCNYLQRCNYLLRCNYLWRCKYLQRCKYDNDTVIGCHNWLFDWLLVVKFLLYNNF